MRDSSLKVRPHSIKHRDIFTISRTKFEYKKQSVSFCVLCCVKDFTIVSCTAPVFSYHLERDKDFGGFYMVRTIPYLWSKNSKTFGSKDHLIMLWDTQAQFIFFSNKSASFLNSFMTEVPIVYDRDLRHETVKLKRSLIKL